MDFHQFESISIEDVKKAHIADISVQDKYGVRYLQFWVNQAEGTVFCLTEGPSAQACQSCHQEAHGNVACNIQPVESGFFDLFMGKSLTPEDHLILTEDGKPDGTNRTILIADIRGKTHVTNVKDYKKLVMSTVPKKLVTDSISQFKGRFVEHSSDDNLIGVFNTPVHAIRCAHSLQKNFLAQARAHGETSEWDLEFRVSLNYGPAMTENGGFFEESLKKSKRLCMLSEPGQITISSDLNEMHSAEIKAIINEGLSIRLLDSLEETFLKKLFDHTEANLTKESFNVNHLCGLIGVSRPQLYRKTTALTGKSPNSFIKDFKMD